MKKFAIAMLIVIVCCSVANALSVDDVMNKAMAELPFEKGSKDLLIMTNLGYSKGSQIYYDDFVRAVLKFNLSMEKNVQFVHSSYNKPLWFAFFNKTTGECLYIRISNDKIAKAVKVNISAEKLLSNPEEFDKKMKSKVFDGNEFSIITIANVWAMGMPWELKRSAEFHNHICPGLTSGYLIAEYIKKHHPPTGGKYYIILAVPPWCKDDALQVIFDSTVGKRRMFVKQLSDVQKSKLPAEFKNIAGIYILWDRSKGRGEGFILTFDWDKACRDSGINRSDFKDFSSYKWWWTRLKMDLDLMRFLNQPERYIKEVKKFNVDAKTLQKLETAGIDPLKELGISKTESTTTNTVKRSPFPTSAMVIAVACVLAYRTLKKR